MNQTAFSNNSTTILCLSNTVIKFDQHLLCTQRSLAYKHIHKNIQIVSDVTLNTHQQLLPKPMPNHPSETHAANVYTLASYAMLCKTRVGPNIHTNIQSVVVDKWS